MSRRDSTRGTGGRVGHDLRAPLLALVAWLAAVAALRAPGWLPGLAAVGLLALVLLGRRGKVGRTSLAAWAIVGLGVAGVVLLRVHAVTRSPLLTLAERRATVSGELVVGSDPVVRPGRFGDMVLVRGTTTAVVGRGTRHRIRAPVLVIADASWRGLRLGTRVAFRGRIEPAVDHDLAGVLATRGPPRVTHPPGTSYAAAERVRAGIRAAVAEQPPGPRVLVPALVDGDDAGLPGQVTEDFRTAGLTHLTAVSGTNLTLVVGCLLVLARWAGVRARGLVVVGAVGVAGFVLLARAEPSVLRAAAMGSVALIGMGSNGRERGTRALGVAVLVLMLLDPWLAVSMGFALSAVATASILLLAPGWRDRLRRWLPRWVAEAIAVPLAAQVGCTPLIAAISGQVSLVAVQANLLAEPVVAPATVLGLFGGLVCLVDVSGGRLVAMPAAWSARWLIWVAHHSAGLPVAAFSWPASPVGITVLTGLCVVLVLLLGGLLASRTRTVCASCLLVVVVLVPLPTPGWPPRGWVLVACSVGQGDGLVLNAGQGRAVVVDAGPDPSLVDRCLRRLHVATVSVLLLTHFHADHVDGLEGVLRGRRVGAIEVSPLADPRSGVQLVRDATAAAHVPVTTARPGEVRTVGLLRWQVLAPLGPVPADSDSPPNDSSVVLLVETAGVRLLMMGDEETPSQERLAASYPGLRADVLKVAHHGSARQDPALVRDLGARLALISVGIGNDYGHPAPSTLHLLQQSGMRVERTDRDGDVAVVVDHGLSVATHGPGH